MVILVVVVVVVAVVAVVALVVVVVPVFLARMCQCLSAAVHTQKKIGLAQ